jgi:hypothetical protein
MPKMTTWAQFEFEAPKLAQVAAELWPGITALHRGEQPAGDHPRFSIAFLATVRASGAPRLHPFCPILAGGRLFAAIPRTSPKGWDLRREPRCVIHAMPGPDDDELCIRALGIEVIDEATRALVREVVERSGVGGMIDTVAGDALFEFDLEQVDTAHWLDIGQPGTRAVRARWRAKPVRRTE